MCWKREEKREGKVCVGGDAPRPSTVDVFPPPLGMDAYDTALTVVKARRLSLKNKNNSGAAKYASLSPHRHDYLYLFIKICIYIYVFIFIY